MKEKRPYLELKKDAFYRHLLWHTSLGNEQNIYLTEFPKSGGTWLAQMLSELLSLPFPRNRSVKKQPCILHGHHQINKPKKKAIHLMRDGRDVMISAYYYLLLNSENPFQKYWKKKMHREDLTDVEAHLSDFIEIFFKNYRSGWSHKKWSDYILHYLALDEVIQVRYEDLNQNTTNAMASILNKLNAETSIDKLEKVVNKYSFKNQTGREKGEINEKAFLRKGDVGDWKNYFNRESAEVFNFYAGDALIRSGYEQNKNWYK